ncbi:hypothetical protein FJZ48_00755 [Candidatus Uhrbacteria bacterium]|nr:hypothetical protein [Candidatus Uhrbacteria bacterium]
MIDALVDQVLLSYKFVICVFAVAMKIEDGLTFVLEFLDILANTSIGLIKFLVPFLPGIKNDCLK